MDKEFILLTEDEKFEFNLPDYVSEQHIFDCFNTILKDAEYQDYALNLLPSILLRFNNIEDKNSLKEIIVFCLHMYYIDQDIFNLVKKTGSHYFITYDPDYIQSILILYYLYSHIDSFENFIKELQKFSQPTLIKNNAIELGYMYHDAILSTYINNKLYHHNSFIDFLIDTKSLFNIEPDILFNHIEQEIYPFLHLKVKNKEIEQYSEFIENLYKFIKNNNFNSLYEKIFESFYDTIYFDMFDKDMNTEYYQLKESFLLKKELYNF